MTHRGATTLRFHYLSDLHLESQDFPFSLPQGDVLIVAGDLCHARVFEADAGDGYAGAQRDRVLRFADQARARFARILLVPGNHEHWDGIFDDTSAILRHHLPGFTVLDDEAVELGGVPVFGTTLWSDFDGRDPEAMRRAGKGCGEFFFVKKREADRGVSRFRPADALAAFDRAVVALSTFLSGNAGRRPVIVTHHAPARAGLNPAFAEGSLAGAYASALDDLIAESGPAIWVHGHTHIRRKYRIGDAELRTNCRGFDGKDLCARSFQPQDHFEL